MIRDALIESNSKYNFIESIQDPEKYYKLNDNIIFEIEWSKEPVNNFFTYISLFNI